MNELLSYRPISIQAEMNGMAENNIVYLLPILFINIPVIKDPRIAVKFWDELNHEISESERGLFSMEEQLNGPLPCNW